MFINDMQFLLHSFPGQRLWVALESEALALGDVSAADPWTKF